MSPIFAGLALLPLSFLAVDGAPESPSTSFALYGLLITTVGSLIKGIIDGRNAACQRKLDIQERAAMREELRENTEITKKGVDQAQTAFHEANNVNAKIAALHEIQARFLQTGTPKEQASRISELTDYVHKRIHDLVGHVLKIDEKVNPHG